MRVNDDLETRWIWIKGGLFLALGALAAAGLVALHPELPTVALLTVAVWAFSRFYFFAFYVVEKWCDPGFRFDGLIHFGLWLWRRRSPDVSRRRVPDAAASSGSVAHRPEPPER